jgi:hypothetical protein
MPNQNSSEDPVLSLKGSQGFSHSFLIQKRIAGEQGGKGERETV